MEGADPIPCETKLIHCLVCKNEDCKGEPNLQGSALIILCYSRIFVRKFSRSVDVFFAYFLRSESV